MESVLTMPPDLIAEDRPRQWRHRNYLIYLVSALALAGCAPTVLSLAVDGAYTASEERTLDDVVDDNGIKLELNKLLLEDGLGLFKDVGTVVYRRHVYLLGDVENAEDKARAGAIGRVPEKVSGVTNDIQVTSEGGNVSFGTTLSAPLGDQILVGLAPSANDEGRHLVLAVRATIQ